MRTATAVHIDHLVDALKQSQGLISLAARIADVPPEWLRRMIVLEPELDAAFYDARELVGDEVERKLIERALSGESERAEIFYAKTRLRNRGYGVTSLTNPTPRTLVDAVATLPPHELEEFIDLMTRRLGGADG